MAMIETIREKNSTILHIIFIWYVIENFKFQMLFPMDREKLASKSVEACRTYLIDLCNEKLYLKVTPLYSSNAIQKQTHFGDFFQITVKVII